MSPGSITLLVEQMRSSDPATREAAARQIWQRHFPRLLTLACQHLDQRLKRRTDEQDVLQSMYASFCFRQQRGDFSMDDRSDLWRLLVTMTLNKTRKAAEKQRSQRRDYRREANVGGAAGAGENDSFTDDEALAQMEDSSPSPAEAAELTEELERRMKALPEALQQIALWKLEGYSNEDIAGPDKLKCTVRTVERKLRLIRELWEAQG
jgi:hypothetical protein